MTKLVDILASIGSWIGKPSGWERIVRLFASPESCRSMRDICVTRDGSVFIAQPALPLGWHVAFFGTYEPKLREILRTVLPIGGVALDVGANVGWHTLLMARLVGPSGRVLAAEANPSVRNRLEDNLRLNRFRDVLVIPYAIGETDGIVQFYGPEANDARSGDGHVVATTADGQIGIINVETRRIDGIFSISQIDRLDLIKIDVEGFEWPVLNGAEQTISKFRPHIVFEYNADYLARGGGSPELLEEFFNSRGYKLFAIGRNWATAIESGHWPRCADIWAVPAGLNQDMTKKSQ